MPVNTYVCNNNSQASGFCPMSATIILCSYSNRTCLEVTGLIFKCLVMGKTTS